MSRARYFAARFFGSRFFGAEAEEVGGYFGAGYFASRHFAARFFRQGPETEAGSITASLDATEVADTLESTAASVVVVAAVSSVRPPRRVRLEPIQARLDVRERRDTCEAVAALGFDPVAMDNNLLLLAA